MNILSILSTDSIKEAIHSWSGMKDALSLIGEERFPVALRGLHGSLSGFFIAEYCKRKASRAFSFNKNGTASFDSSAFDTLVVVPGAREEIDITLDLNTFFPEAEIINIPWWGMVPYRPAAKGAAIFGERAAALTKLATPQNVKGRVRIFIMSQRVFQSPLPPPNEIIKHTFTIRTGDALDTQALAKRLSSIGYTRVPRVYLRGEFSLRGEVLDVFVPGNDAPARIIMDFNTVEKIKRFDTDTQTTAESLASLTVTPMKEIVWDETLLSLLKKQFDEYEENAVGAAHNFDEAASAHLPFTEKAKEKIDEMLLELSEIGQSEGEELFYPILWGGQYSVRDYVGKNVDALFFDYDRLVNAEENMLKEFSGLYRRARLDFPAFPPDNMLFNFHKILETFSRRMLFYTVAHDDETSDDADEAQTPQTRIQFASESARSFFGNIHFLKEELTKFQNDGWKIAVYAGGENQRSRIAELLREFTSGGIEDRSEKSGDRGQGTENRVANSVKFGRNGEKNINYDTSFNNIKSNYAMLFNGTASGAKSTNKALNYDTSFSGVSNVNSASATPAPSCYLVAVFAESISEGFSIPDIKLLVIQENEIFGRRRAAPKSLKKAKSAVLDSFVELSPGDYVVHVQYGIGIFRGIERVKAAGNERDYIKLEYADGEFAFVPIEQVNMVQRYVGSEGERPKIDKIGSKSWENRKSHAREAVEELAQKLIALYSRRKASRGFAFPKDTEWQTSFEAAFPYEDTPDQATVSEEVKRDMEKPVPMDRLICGDVGYGKTEIAMRAAFKAIMGGKQVVFLAPTTILAEQHYETCLERFNNFPVKIEMLSRFVPHAEQKKILTKLTAGEVDLLIGTHRVVQKDVAFKNLGLLIIDEEQRFGVKDKERLKELKANIDCLSLSATPIPRTLHMSLLKIRDMSLLTTPPPNRQAIETVVEPYNDEKIVRAIRREVERGGQVFFLHNRVASLLETRRHLERLVPEMLIDIAHGQMGATELDDIFRRFKMGGFHVLVSTTIVENGIDIPNVNTIIIDRADIYGVSQLYQLRGRVGRSDRKAYAYLFYPENSALSELAMKRLQVVSDFTELGSGFKIAMKDMEIRGAGNLLGRDQSGDVYAVGFDLYLKLLNEAIERLLAEKDWRPQSETLMELEYTGFIPDGYVQSAETKMEIYKKIAQVESDAELVALMNEIEDRFGPVPDEVASLLSLSSIRILCKRLNIASLKEKAGVVQVEFARVSDISVEKVLRLIKDSAGGVTLDAAKPNALFLKLGKIGLKEKSEFIREKLERLA